VNRKKKRSFAGSRTEALVYGILSLVILLAVWHLVSLGGRIG